MPRALATVLTVLAAAACARGEPIDPTLSGGGGGAGTVAGGGGSGSGSDTAASSSTGSGSAAGGAGAGAGGEGGAGTCGDGFVTGDEECDDGNATPDDGCTACEIDCGVDEEKYPPTGHCYRVFAAPMTQPLAESNCQAWGGAPGLGHLASVGDANEQAFLSGLAVDETWIGADDFGGDWAWIDGTPFTFETWDVGEPNFPGVEHCLFMSAAGPWHDHNCGDVRPAYLCERRGAGTF